MLNERKNYLKQKKNYIKELIKLYCQKKINKFFLSKKNQPFQLKKYYL